MHRLCLTLLPARFAICKLPAGAPVPEWADRGPFCSITRTSDELSVITTDREFPPDVICDHGWRALKVEGPLEFSLTGVLESIARPLAEAGISLFAVATYNTDYVLVKEDTLQTAVAALNRSGHNLLRPFTEP